MEQNYKQALEAAMRCENDLKNQIDDKNHDVARSLLDGTRQLVSEINASKNPRSLEGRVKALMDMLNQAKAHGEVVMDPGHIKSIIDNFEDLRRKLKEFDNY